MSNSSMNVQQQIRESRSAKSIVIGSSRPDFLQKKTLPEFFRASAKKFPNKIALIYKNESITYEELDRWSDAIAADLMRRGIGKGAAVGVWWPRGFELHAVILGITKAGAAYVPLDYDMPLERVTGVLTEVKAAACFSQEQLELTCPILSVLPRHVSYLVSQLPEGPRSEDSAYILYTSGSTGKPKGIPINHRQICHLVYAEQNIFGIRSDDRVYQGFSVSFDMWCEETWISYFVGATLLIADSVLAKSIDELSNYLRASNVTVLHAVPSLLALMDEHIPTLRIVNVGGEACTPQVLERWTKPGRLFFNSYGPSEATVSATIAQLKSGDNIHIGEPLANYALAVVDENLNLLPCGEKGELIISGPGVGEGYINRPELTQQKFIPKTKNLMEMPGDRIYRTGDAAFVSEDGLIYIQGRLDDQIKLRGYRIELDEIESQLHHLPGVSAAAVVVKKDRNNQDHLVAYFVGDEHLLFNDAQMRIELGKHLPSYMIPSMLIALETMPRLASGKIDKKALPTPDALKQINLNQNDIIIDANAPLAKRVTSVLQNVFPGRAIDLSDDFFDHLGGHSLLAAKFVSTLRTHAGVEHAAIKDVYLHRPLSALVDAWHAPRMLDISSTTQFNRIPFWRHFLCGTAQSITLFFIFGLFALQVFLPYLMYYFVQQQIQNYVVSISLALLSFCFIPPVFALFTIVSKWLIIGRMRPGDYPLWGLYYFRWWLTKTIQKLTPMEYLNGTPLYPIYLRLMGVNVAADANLSVFNVGAEDLITIGKDVSISSGVMFDNAVVEEGLLKLRSIHIDNHAYIGSGCVVSSDCRIEEWGELKDLSSLKANTVIKKYELWQGSPAVYQRIKATTELQPPLPVSKAKRWQYCAIYSLVLFIFPFMITLPLLPTLIALNVFDSSGFSYLYWSPLYALSYIALFAFGSMLLNYLLQHNIKPGTYPIYSRVYLRKWFADQIVTMSLFVLHSVYATVFSPIIFRALGAKVGQNSEISTARQVTHHLLEIGDNAFIADGVNLGEYEVRGQRLTLQHTRIGDNSFVGNNALIPQDYHLPCNMLVGVLSIAPTRTQLQVNAAKNWFGSPAIALPRRQESQCFPIGLTLYPSNLRKLARGLVEFARIILPTAVMICLSVLFVDQMHEMIQGSITWNLVWMFPCYYLMIVGLPALFITLTLKWLLVGKYRAKQIPMWTWMVWRTEAVTATYEALAVAFFIEFLKGTPLICFVLRLFGAKIGKRAWMNTTDLTEFDMVNIGDDTALNNDSGPQTHLFEDRVMKVGTVKIGSRCSIGAGAVVLYDSVIEDDVTLDALSLVMKGENLPTRTRWGGSPVKSF